MLRDGGQRDRRRAGSGGGRSSRRGEGGTKRSGRRDGGKDARSAEEKRHFETVTEAATAFLSVDNEVNILMSRRDVLEAEAAAEHRRGGATRGAVSSLGSEGSESSAAMGGGDFVLSDSAAGFGPAAAAAAARSRRLGLRDPVAERSGNIGVWMGKCMGLTRRRTFWPGALRASSPAPKQCK